MLTTEDRDFIQQTVAKATTPTLMDRIVAATRWVRLVFWVLLFVGLSWAGYEAYSVGHRIVVAMTAFEKTATQIVSLRAALETTQQKLDTANQKIEHLTRATIDQGQALKDRARTLMGRDPAN